MKNKNSQYLFRTVLFVFALFGATSAFAHGHDGIAINTGVISPCQPLWLVIAPNNPTDNVNQVCVDVPVNYHGKVKVVFNLDSPVQSSTNPDSSVGLHHMVLLSRVLQHQIEIGNLSPNNISVIGIFHGSAMSKDHWPFTDSPEAGLLQQVLDFNHASPPIHTQLEVCGVTLKGMMMHGAMMSDGSLVTQADLYPGVLVDQGAIARLVQLERNGYTYIQDYQNQLGWFWYASSTS
ncbi:MAG: hypothetical protein P8047_13720 [Gammaproteobacteria bacterium]